MCPGGAGSKADLPPQLSCLRPHPQESIFSRVPYLNFEWASACVHENRTWDQTFGTLTDAVYCQVVVRLYRG